MLMYYYMPYNSFEANHCSILLKLSQLPSEYNSRMQGKAEKRFPNKFGPFPFQCFFLVLSLPNDEPPLLSYYIQATRVLYIDEREEWCEAGHCDGGTGCNSAGGANESSVRREPNTSSRVRGDKILSSTCVNQLHRKFLSNTI